MPAAARGAGGLGTLNLLLLAFLLCVLFGYRWITREISVTGWLVARMFETTKFRSLFHPGYFITPPDQTAAEAMQSRREEAHGLMGMGTRMLQGEMDEVHDVTVPVKGGEIPARIYIPRVASGEEAVEDRGVMIWLHGGGWMFGNVEAHDQISMDLAEASEMIVVAVGYRLAPEFKFPVPVQDCVAAVKWVKKYIGPFGGDTTKIALVGESSGGNLAMAAALQLGMSWSPFPRKKSEICAVVAASAPLSYAHAKEGQQEGDGQWRSYQRYWSGYLLEGDQMKGYWDAYLGKEKDGQRPLASPLRASKRMLRSLPPVLLFRAEHEILWDEISEMGIALSEADQEVVEIQSKSCLHGTFAKGSDACGKRSLEDTASFLKEYCQ